MAKRNRVIYQSEALFVSAQYSGGKTIDIIDGSHNGITPSLATGDFHQIHRVQSANYNFAISRTDVNQFGNLARIDSAIIEAPTVGLDFSFLITDGSNEDKLGITVQDSRGEMSAISGILSNVSGRNYHIVTTAEGTDANVDRFAPGAGALANKSQATTSTIISIGNGFITNYSMNAAIGSIPSASISVEGLNITAQPSHAGAVTTPAMNSSNSTAGTATFVLPQPESGHVGDILRPGDMEINLNDATGLLANFADTASRNSAHIQSFSIDVPLGRSVLNRLGNAFGFSKEIDFPVTVSCSISAIVADLKAGNLFNELYSTDKHDMQIVMRKPAAGGGSAGAEQIRYKLKGVVLDSESFSSSIGDNKTVDLSFSATVGGPEDVTNGLFISGSPISDKQRAES